MTECEELINLAWRIDHHTAEPSSTVSRRPSTGVRLLQALPFVVGLGTFGFFFLDKNREARTVFKSGRGLLTVAAIVAGYAVIAFVLRRYARWAWVPPLVLTAVVLGLAAWIVRPYYVDETVNRRLVTGPVDTVPAAPQPRSSAAPAPAPTPASPPGPTRLGSGALRGLGHEASGSVSLIRSAEGSLVVRFESFDIEGVPDPRVHLVRGIDVQRAGGASLGALKGNRGQILDYAVPAGTDAGPGWTVLVWCRAFSVPVANATLT